MMNPMRMHGGVAPENYTDFSTPINPLGVPDVIRGLISESIKSEIYSFYPNYNYTALREAIAEFYNIEPSYIIPLNGAAEALYLIVGAEKPTTAIVCEPTFGDHRALFHALSMNYISVQYAEFPNMYVFPFNIVYMLSKSIKSKCIILFSNPNNPLGTCIPIEVIEKILHMYRNCIVIVDEAFMDLSRICRSAFKLVEEYKNIVILRSLTKTFAVPGLRIGFLYTSNTKLLHKIEVFRQPWNVNSIADYVFSRALTDYRNNLNEFLEHSKSVIEAERQFLEYSFSELGLHFYKSYAPFILVRFHNDVKNIQHFLERFKIWIRDASSFQFLTRYHGRISVRLREDNEKLINALRIILKEKVYGEAQ